MADVIKKFKAGETVCSIGAYEMWMYELLSGKVSVYKGEDANSAERIAQIESGFIGEMGLIAETPRTATVIADTDIEVALISEEDYMEYFNSHPEKLGSIIDCLSERLRATNDEYMKACATIRDYIAANEANKPKSSALVEAMRGFARKMVKKD